MMTRRDLAAGMTAMMALLGSNAFAEGDGAPGAGILGSTVFDWTKLTFKKVGYGEVCSLCKQETATIDELEMHITKLNPGMSPHPPHQHVNEELIIIREGQCETLSNGKWVPCGPGSVVFNASNILHGFKNVGTTQAVYHVINWSPAKKA